MYFFNVPLTVHLGIILVNNQLDALFFQCIYLFRFSICFEQHSAHHQENRIVLMHHLVYVTRCRWLLAMPVRKFLTYTRCCTDTIRFSWWWALCCSKHIRKGNKETHWKKCVKLVINKNYTEMHGQRNIQNLLKRSICYALCPSITFRAVRIGGKQANSQLLHTSAGKDQYVCFCVKQSTRWNV